MSAGYIGKILFVDLTSGEVEEEEFSDSVYRMFLGGYGLGVRILYERMKPNSDPLGPNNIIGFAPGILTATGVPMSSRYEVVTKSPLTNAWAQGNSGGFFGQGLKSAGYDAIFFTGISPKPVYLLLHNGKGEIRDARHLWGKDTVETEKTLQNELSDTGVRVSCIGPSGESLSLISCVISDGGRAAARSGTGAVMGSKRLKAIAVKGNRKVAVADPERLKILRNNFLKNIRESKDFMTDIMKHYGTCGTFVEFVRRGDAPIKNWSLSGFEAFPTADKIHKDNVTKYQVKKFTCPGCPIGCGGIVKIERGPFKMSEGHKPEYETLASFGSLCLNDDVESIIMANDICNRYGLDTISAGTTIAFAIECYENNIISKKETGGIELTWGNAAAMIKMLNKLARREEFGNILADGVMRAAKQIGRGSDKYAMHIGGQEPGCRDSRFVPSRGVGYIADPAPGRHTATSIQVKFEQAANSGITISNYPELQRALKELKGGALSAVANKYEAIISSAGLCSFVSIPGTYPVIELISSVTGWDFSMQEALRTGHRIQTLRMALIFRENVSPENFRLPERMSRTLIEGPLAGRTFDFNALRKNFYEAMGWVGQGVKAGYPLQQTLEQLGLSEFVAKDNTMGTSQ
ncbi:MAG: aldehyde ferredoxin oxidoreductase family protein [Thermodesulfobacteriota bacterium]